MLFKGKCLPCTSVAWKYNPYGALARESQRWELSSHPGAELRKKRSLSKVAKNVLVFKCCQEHSSNSCYYSWACRQNLLCLQLHVDDGSTSLVYVAKPLITATTTIDVFFFEQCAFKHMSIFPLSGFLLRAHHNSVNYEIVEDGSFCLEIRNSVDSIR